MRASTLLTCLVLSVSLNGNAQEMFHSSSVRTLPVIAMGAPDENSLPLHAAPRDGGSASVTSTSSSISSVASVARPASPLIVIGFMGGRVHADNTIHSEASLAYKLQRDYPNQIHAKVFANHDEKKAYRDVLQTLDVNHDGSLNPAEKQNARIVIYGHSWGASETVNLARKLGRDGIAVLLTIQVDSIAKIGEEDGFIPANVAQAVNFYQPEGLLHGRKVIHAVDPEKTQIIGNFRFSYSDHHIQCSHYPWFARTFVRPHIEIENDPRVWDWIEAAIQAELPGSSPVGARELPASGRSTEFPPISR